MIANLEKAMNQLQDEGPLSAADTLLARRFHLWRDGNGRRQVFSVYPVDDAPAYPDAVAIAVRRSSGRCTPVWSGPTGAKARAAAYAAGADEIHLRVLPRAESGPLSPE
jgi:hypothetical protein